MAPAPEKARTCPHREECLSLKGAPIGMYHCPICGEMVLAGVDPSPLCAAAAKQGSGTEEK